MKSTHRRIAAIGGLVVLSALFLIGPQKAMYAQAPVTSQNLASDSSASASSTTAAPGTPPPAASGAGNDAELLRELETMRTRIAELEERIKSQSAPPKAPNEATPGGQSNSTGPN